MRRWPGISRRCGTCAIVSSVLLLAHPLPVLAQSAGGSGGAQAPALTPATAGKPGPTGWLLSGMLSIAAVSGNAESKTFQANASYLRSWPEWGWVAKASGLRQSAGTGQVAEAYFIALEGSRRINDRLSFIVGESIYRNQFAGIDHRNVLGAGIRWATVRTPRWQLDLLSAAGWEHDNYIAAAGVDDQPMSLVQVENHVQVTTTSTTSAQVAWFQDLSDAGNYRLNADAALQSRVTSWLSLSVAFSLAFDNEPVAAPKKADTTVTAGFQFNFSSGG